MIKQGYQETAVNTAIKNASQTTVSNSLSSTGQSLKFTQGQTNNSALAKVNTATPAQTLSNTTSSASKSTQEINKGYFIKLTGILFKPLQVLEEYKSEEGIIEPFKFMLISAVIAGLISLIFELISGTSISLVAIAFGAIIVVQTSIVFVLSGVFHLLVKLFGGKNPYYQTFKAFAYVSCFWIIGSLITSIAAFFPIIRFVNVLLGLWILTLIGSCLKNYTDLSSGKLMAIWVIIIILLVIILFFVISAVLPMFVGQYLL